MEQGNGPRHTHNYASGHTDGNLIQAGSIGEVHFHDQHRLSTTPKPRQLVRRPSGWVDREDELNVLDSATDVSERIGALVVLSGPAGVGKSALALHWLYRRLDRYVDGQLYTTFASAPGCDILLSPMEVLRGWLTALGCAPEHVPLDLGSAAALYRSMTAERRLAVVIEDAVTTAQVRPLVPAGEHAVTLVTSRFQLSGLALDGALHVRVGPMSTSAAIDLLSRTAGHLPEKSHHDAARELVTLCGRLPLAVRMAGSRLALRPTQSLSGLLEQLRDERHRLSRLRVEGEETSMKEVLDSVYRELPRLAARLYRVMGGGPLTMSPAQAIAAAAGVGETEAREALETLVDTSLAEEAEAGRYRLHDLIAVHARERFVREEKYEQAREILDRFTDWFLDTAIIAARTVRPYEQSVPPPVIYPPVTRVHFTDLPAALDWLETELPALKTVAQAAAARGDFARAYQLASRMWALWAYRKHYGPWNDIDQLGLECAQQLGDVAGQAAMLRRLGLRALDLAEYSSASALFERAAEMWERTGDMARLASVRHSLAVTHLRRHELATAHQQLAEVLLAYHRLGDHRNGALAHIDLADVLTEMDRPEPALTHVREALAVLKTSPDVYSTNHARTLAGRALSQLGRLDEAEAELLRAIDALQTVRSVEAEAEAWGYAGATAEWTGRMEVARARYEHARNLLEQANVPSDAWVRERVASLTPLSRATFEACPNDPG